MFAKPYKLKSSNTLKNTEKKHLAQRIQNEFPGATEDKIKELVPVKSTSSCMKLVVHSGETVGVFVVDGVPVMLEVGEALVPTVCALWKVPDLVPTLIIHSLVLPKVQGGAPLYAPGVITSGLSCPQFPRNAVLGVCTSDNAAVGIVGRAIMSSADLLYKSMGVCLETYHVFGDLLCKDPKFSKIQRPRLGPPSNSDVADNITADIRQLSIQTAREEWPSLVKEEPLTPVAANEPKVIQDEQEKEVVQEDTETTLNDTVGTDNSELEEDAIPEDMDGLLRWCLLSFLKMEGKNLQLPLKTNILYKNHLIPMCPPDRTLDVKKSTYKKMSKFLEAMEREGLVEVRELERGVAALVSVNHNHPLVRAHRAPLAAPLSAPAAGAEYVPPQVREVYCITANVAELFMPLKKGTPLSGAEVRSTLTEYVRSRELQSTEVRGAVVLDATLAKASGKKEQEHVKWEELMQAVQARCTAGTALQFADGRQQLARARLPPVTMQVVSRAGNKKVTLVSNLEAYGLNLAALAQACQRGVAASCGVTRSAAAKTDQLMLQGDQTHFVAKLLIEKYGLPKKYVEGADKALNKKK
ncbi:eukaryotic translation initiation factor 2D [Epargyreus clarus]|uniref:eukaryotic translation initiation factor 2D n=1 Tax=Epargyreus clarus TaxID=520877 RepID=UPI003C2BA406